MEWLLFYFYILQMGEIWLEGGGCWASFWSAQKFIFKCDFVMVYLSKNEGLDEVIKMTKSTEKVEYMAFITSLWVCWWL